MHRTHGSLKSDSSIHLQTISLAAVNQLIRGLEFWKQLTLFCHFEVISAQGLRLRADQVVWVWLSSKLGESELQKVLVVAEHQVVLF